MCGRCGLNTVGSCEKPTTTWPFGASCASANPRPARPGAKVVMPAAPISIRVRLRFIEKLIFSLVMVSLPFFDLEVVLRILRFHSVQAVPVTARLPLESADQFNL